MGKPIFYVIVNHEGEEHGVLPFALQRYLDQGWIIVEAVEAKESKHETDDNTSEADQ